MPAKACKPHRVRKVICKKKPLPPALKMYKKALDDVLGKPKKGEFRKAPKKGSADYKKVKARYMVLKKQAEKKK